MSRKQLSETPIWDAITKEYRAKRKMPVFVTWAPNCKHDRIEPDEPIDGGGQYYRCMNPKCWKVIDPDEWEWEHNKEWDWYLNEKAGK